MKQNNINCSARKKENPANVLDFISKKEKMDANKIYSQSESESEQKKSFDQGSHHGRKIFRQRCKEIMFCPAAECQQKFADTLALKTDLNTEDAISLLTENAKNIHSLNPYFN